MWIETSDVVGNALNSINSFASNGECGLKLALETADLSPPPNSFASNGECGLKQIRGVPHVIHHMAIHSPAMANVD